MSNPSTEGLYGVEGLLNLGLGVLIADAGRRFQPPAIEGAGVVDPAQFLEGPAAVEISVAVIGMVGEQAVELGGGFLQSPQVGQFLRQSIAGQLVLRIERQHLLELFKSRHIGCCYHSAVACPFFYATHRHSNWMSQRPVPLGDFYRGECRSQTDPYIPDDERLFLCNLGYAREECPRFPAESRADQTRFAIAENTPFRLMIRVVQESAYRPLASLTLEFDLERQVWTASHSDPMIQRQAEAYVEAYLRRGPMELRKEAHG